jgi:hypothetical protein
MAQNPPSLKQAVEMHVLTPEQQQRVASNPDATAQYAVRTRRATATISDTYR